MFEFEYLKVTIAVFISNAISDHEISFEIKHTIKHDFRLKLSFIKRQTSGTSSDNEWQQKPTSGITSDNE